MIVEFIREHADRREERDNGGLRWGVEPICTVLTVHGLKGAPSTYYEHVGKTPTARDQRDEFLVTEIRRVHAANYGVYGARKVWLQLNREGVPVARSTIERLMKAEGLTGAIRGGRISPSSSECVMMTAPIRRVETPQLVVQAYSRFPSWFWNWILNARAKFCPRKWLVPA